MLITSQRGTDSITDLEAGEYNSEKTCTQATYKGRLSFFNCGI